MAVADDAASTQEAAPAPPPRDAAARTGWAAGWASLLLLAVWMGQLTPGWLPAAAACAVAWAVLARTVPGPWRAATLAALAVTLGLWPTTGRGCARPWTAPPASG
jgi:hypothetical protein